MKVNHHQESDCSDPDAMDVHKNEKSYQWKAIGRYKEEFSPHQMIIYNTDRDIFYVLGGNGNKSSCLLYDQKNLKKLSNMPQEKTFFAAVYFENIIYTFGGYDAYDK